MGGPPPGNPAGLVRLQHHAGVGQTHRFHFVCSRREHTVSKSGLTERFLRRSSPGPSPPVRGRSWEIPDPNVSGTPAFPPAPLLRTGGVLPSLELLANGITASEHSHSGSSPPRCTSEAPSGHHPHRPAPSGSKPYPNLNPNTSRGGTRLCLVCTQAGWNIPQGPLHGLQWPNTNPRGTLCVFYCCKL